MIDKLLQPKPDNKKYNELIVNIKNGNIQIPQFQRDFVWSLQKSTDLLDSILKGYPIGTFILWKTKNRLRNIKKLGNIVLANAQEGDSVYYVLDGQQRLASLYVVINGLTIVKDTKQIDYGKIFIDLDNNDDTENIVTSEEPHGISITIHDLLNAKLTFFTKNFTDNYIQKIEKYRRSLQTYDFSTIILEDYSLEKAVDIFNRINTTGLALTLFEIMVAKTYDEEINFDLNKKYEELNTELSQKTYRIPPAQLLQCISMNLTNECKRKTILNLKKQEIINVLNDTNISIKSAIDHFKSVYKIPASHLLPYSALIVPFSYFFYKHKSSPTIDQDKYLKEYFWKSSLTSRFGSAVESKLAQDIKLIDEILDGNKPYFDKEFKVNITRDEIKELQFHTNDAINKAILCVFAFFEPKSFKNNNLITLDNSYLIQGNSKNYHHFFPKAYLKKRQIDEKKINLISNITLVDDYLNKREIRDKPPSEYISKFKNDNPSIDETMKTHLIDNLDDYGVFRDDYEQFITSRTERIWSELQKRFESN